MGQVIFLTALGLPVMYFGGVFFGGPLVGWLFVAGSIGLMALIVWGKKVGWDRFAKFVEADGEPDYRFDDFAFPSSIAINRRAGKVYLRGDGKMRRYSFDDVRGFHTMDERAGRIIGWGLGAGMAAAAENQRAKDRARKASGLFVTVRDIDRPEWQVHMKAADQKKWLEILNQIVVEGSSDAQRSPVAA